MPGRWLLRQRTAIPHVPYRTQYIFHVVLAKGGKRSITEETSMEMETHQSLCSSSLGWTCKNDRF